MDLIKAVQNYFSKMVNEVSGMKVLLLDNETTPIISMVFTQSQLLAHEVYLIDRIENQSREKMSHLKCICFVRPSDNSMQALIDELRSPCYSDYYIYFSNIAKKSQIERLAEVDDSEVVREVQEYYADYLTINNDFFSLNLSSPRSPVYGDGPQSWDARSFQRSLEGVLSLLLSLKKRPLIRFDKNSNMCKRLAQEINYSIQQENALFDFRRPDTPPILLLLDRRNDPVTPLLNQWTYQAMVHELIGIDNGRVDLSNVPDIRPELKEVVLATDSDPFYKKNMFLNLGDLGANIKEYVDEYQVKHKSSAHIESISDMKKFVEEFPEFRKLSGNVTKHVTLVGELSRLVDRGGLLEVGELEQNLACVENHTTDLRTLQTLINNPKVSEDSKVKLVLLYVLRYEKSPQNSVKGLLEALKDAGVSERKGALIDKIVSFAGADQRQEDLFLNQNVLSKTKAVFKGLKGVENIYTQHTPHLISTLESLVKGRLKDTTHPFIDGSTRDKPQDILIFIVGGTTYAESRAVSTFVANNPGVRVVLGGTTVHNSQSFLSDMAEAVSRWQANGKAGAGLQATSRESMVKSNRVDEI